jgi:hypothetical protein
LLIEGLTAIAGMLDKRYPDEFELTGLFLFLFVVNAHFSKTICAFFIPPINNEHHHLCRQKSFSITVSHFEKMFETLICIRNSFMSQPSTLVCFFMNIV